VRFQKKKAHHQELSWEKESGGRSEKNWETKPRGEPKGKKRKKSKGRTLTCSPSVWTPWGARKTASASLEIGIRKNKQSRAPAEKEFVREEGGLTWRVDESRETRRRREMDISRS